MKKTYEVELEVTQTIRVRIEATSKQRAINNAERCGSSLLSSPCVHVGESTTTNWVHLVVE